MGIKTIYHLHGGSFDTIYEQYNPLVKALVRFILRRADVIVALSVYWQEFLAKLVERDKIHIVPNPINCDELSTYSVQNPKVINYSVVLLGSLGKRKGHYDVLKAIPQVLQKFPAVQFYFAGLDEDIGATIALQELAEENNLSANIHFLGPVFGVDKLELLGSAGVVILPSYGENMPISVLEGMAAWKPVISTRVGAIPEVITHNESGLLIDPGDWLDLAKRICYLFEKPTIAYGIGRNAGEKVRENWDIDKMKSRFKQLYKLLI
jgi:glycosyltransferase involved in cell wall biosynthesis